MRKLKIIGSIIGLTLLINIKAFADTNEYEKVNILPKKIILTEEYTPQEVIDDYEGMQSIYKLKNKTEKSYEIGIAKGDGKFTFVEGVDTYEEAVLKIKNKKSSIIINSKGEIVYTTTAIGRIVNLKDGNPEYSRNEVVKIYQTENATDHITYINSGYIDDVVVLEQGAKRVKILVNGVKGWIDREQNGVINIVLVPLNQAKNLSYYEKNNSGDLIHYISTDVTTQNKGNKIIVGKAPTWMNVGTKYYSYDCNYFYTNIETLIIDANRENNLNAVNKNEKYYNYYSYLPGRSKTTYSKDEINSYFINNTPSNSILRGKGEAFTNAQEKYGVNAGVMIGVAMNESAKGTSNIALNKNNIFGLNAVDSNVGQADRFNSIEECVQDFAQNWMSKRYYNPQNWVYNGTNLGNKYAGINVQYASDPFWGEKASRYYYEIDKKLGNKDIFKYNIAIYSKEDSVKDSSGNLLYKVLKNKNKSARVGYPVIITSEQNDEYSVNPDTQNNSEGIYNWSLIGKIKKDSLSKLHFKLGEWIYKDNNYYFKLNDGTYATEWMSIEGKWYYFNAKGQMKTGWLNLNDTWYYLKESGEMATGWLNLNGYYYYLYDWGGMATGWLNLNGQYYYLYDWGGMATGWLKLNGYYYYLYDWGGMATGWNNISGKWYYMYNSGEMATNTTIDGWKIGSDGVANRK